MGYFPEKEETFAEFDAMGEDQVRLWLEQSSDPYSVSAKLRRSRAIEWLSKHVQDARLRTETSQAESLETAKSSKDAAWEAADAAREAVDEAKKANVIATIALIAAAIAIAVSVIGIFLGH